MIIWKNKLIPFKGYKIFNFLGLILFVRGDEDVTEIELNHEKIHSAQMKEMLWVPFYLWYIVEYLLIRIFGKGKTQNEDYHDVSFEEEAYSHQNDLEYLKNRKHFAWWKYLKTGSYKK